MATSDRSYDAFNRALDEARGRASEPDAKPRFRRNPSLHAEVALGPERGGGGEARWDHAMIWADDPMETPPPPPALASEPLSASAEMVEAIAEALGFGAALTQRQITSRWRDFIWRNHPDRQPAHARERANARVAIANALYDRARRELAKR